MVRNIFSARSRQLNDAVGRESLRQQIILRSRANHAANEQVGAINQTVYVNVDVDYRDVSLNNKQLLQRIHANIWKGMVRVDLLPESAWKDRVVSIEVECPYRLNERYDILLRRRCLYYAEKKVRMWIREFVRKRSPIDRLDLFRGYTERQRIDLPE